MKQPCQLFILGALFLNLAGSLSAHDGRTPLVRVTPDFSETSFDLASLGLAPDSRINETTSTDGLTRQGLRARIEDNSLSIALVGEAGWSCLRTTGGDLLVQRQAGVPVPISYRGARRDSVFVFGDFNSWNRQSLPLDPPETLEGLHQRRLFLPPGSYSYLLQVNGVELRDPANPDSVPNGFGSWNSRLVVEGTGGKALVLNRLGMKSRDEGRCVSFLVEGAPADQVSWNGLHGNRALSRDQVRVSGDTLHVQLPGKAPSGPDLLRFAVSRGTRASMLQTVFLDQDFLWEDAIVYALMPDRFRDGNPENNDPVIHEQLHEQANWQGGDIAGIRRAMEAHYFSKLGVNVLWIYPLNESTDKAWREYPEPHRWYTGYHGYWPVHPTAIEPRFGDEQEFRDLVRRAHQHGMRVIMDLVANHVHEEHPWVSEHPDWFGNLYLPDGRPNLRLWDEHRLTTWFEPYMPDIDFSSSDDAIETVTDVAVDWIRRYNLDGFRHDAVKHVPRLFWSRLTTKLGAEFPGRDLLQIGETFGSEELIASYVGPDAMDAQFNFNLFHPAREIFLDEDRGFDELAAILEQNLAFHGPNHRMGNLMDSHDKARYPSFAEGDISLSGENLQERAWTDPPQNDDKLTYRKTKLYLAYLLGIPGIPFIYYGDEIAMAGAADPDNRRMMRFGKDLDARERTMLRDTSELIALRRERPELRRGDFRVLLADREVLCFMRSAEDETGRPSRSLIALNKSSTRQKRRIDLPLELGSVTVTLDAYDNHFQPLSEETP